MFSKGFLGGSEGKESTCNAGDLGLIPGSERSPGERNSHSGEFYGQRSLAGLPGVAKSQTGLSH